MSSKQVALITKGIRDAFKRDDRYKRAINSSRVVKTRKNKDGSISKKPDVYHRCNKCSQLFKRLLVQVDHINPVVPTNKKQVNMTIQEYLDNTFNHPLQILCKKCHAVKSKIENKTRRSSR